MSQEPTAFVVGENPPSTRNSVEIRTNGIRNKSGDVRIIVKPYSIPMASEVGFEFDRIPVTIVGPDNRVQDGYVSGTYTGLTDCSLQLFIGPRRPAATPHESE
jgi:hypothetical protein